MKKRDTSKEDAARIKFRYVDFELEGGSLALQDSLRSVVSAIVRNGSATGKPALSRPVRQSSNGELSDDAEELANDFDVAELESGGEPSEESSTKQRRARKIPSPRVLDIDVVGGNMPLKKFIEENKPGDADSKRYLVIAAWLKQVKAIEELSMDEVHTCYRAMGWNTPADPVQPMRDLKKRSWFDRKGKGKYAINHLGENQVRDMSGSPS
jgi:hypothetical protein